jgi:hypothetical protein
MDALDHWLVGRAGGRVSSSDVAVWGRWVLAFTLVAAGLGYVAQRVRRGRIEEIP